LTLYLFVLVSHIAAAGEDGDIVGATVKYHIDLPLMVVLMPQS
jgi:hypothetical protein